MDAVEKILKENERRRSVIYAPFNPITGEGSVGEREVFTLSDFSFKKQWLPVEMMDEPFVKALQKSGSIKKFIKRELQLPDSDEAYEKVVEQFVRIRIKHDFAFWAALFVYIKNKDGGDDVLFKLTRPQRRFVERLERLRKAGKPIRIIMVKARQWGGSTTSQIYMAWLQLVHMKGLNSLIIAHQGTGSDEIKDMFDKMIKAYPVSMLHELGDVYQENEPKMVGVGKSGSTNRVPQRNCKIKVGTAERPNSCRGGSYNLVHLSEVGLWKETDGKKPEDIVRSACAGILLKPYTMIVYESTPNGVGNFFHKEYLAAKEGKSQFEAMCVTWHDIEQYELAFDDNRDRLSFAEELYKNRDSEEVQSDREEPGKYLWWLWEQQGATLEGIHWYIEERTKYTNHGDMASEYPSDDIEAFTFSGRIVFPNEDVEQFRGACKPPRWQGEIYGKSEDGADALEGLRFKKETNGRLKVWADVERDDEETVLDRYLVVVDVGKGHTDRADFSVILVLDRIGMIDGEPPVVVAEWHGHIDMDKLAWKAAQVAAYYNNALLVIESNTLETNNTKGEAEYILTLISDVYGNLYARKQSAEDIQQKLPKKYGFHTNTLTKPVIIINLKTIVREHLYIEREEACLDEYLTYVETDKGEYKAKEGYHDDRLMTRAIGMQVCFHDMDLPRVVSKVRKQDLGRRRVVSEATL